MVRTISTMSTTPANIEPKKATANDSLVWQHTVSDYPPSDGWQYTAALRGPQNIDLTADEDGIFSTTAPGIAGDYFLQVYATKDSERYTIYTGTLSLAPDLSAITTATYDGRSAVKKILDSLDNVIAGRASKGDQSVTIGDTRLDKMHPAELLKWRSMYATRYWRECNPGMLAPTVSVGFKRF